VRSGLDLDGAAAAGGLHEFADGPAGLVVDPPADGQGGEDDRQVGFDRVASAVVDGPGLEVASCLLDTQDCSALGLDRDRPQRGAALAPTVTPRHVAPNVTRTFVLPERLFDQNRCCLVR
jgi:hypothetical protein